MRNLFIVVGLFALPFLSISSAVIAGDSKSPNVVVFLADDAGWGDYSHSGNRQVATPNIDSIAKFGVSLDRFFVCPVCSPTRAEFLTGRYHMRGGVRGVSTGHERLNLDERTIAESFRAAGYATGAFGKWHNGSQWPYHPMARGFEEYFGHSSGHWGEYFDPPLEDRGKMVRTRGYIVDVCTDRAIQFIERNRERPFFCYIPFTTPHSPWAVPEEYWGRFRDKPIKQRASGDAKEVDDETRCALAMVENQDWNVGRVLSKLTALGLGENTIVVYFADNGPNSWRWNGEMKGRKGSTDEGGIRSVCYIRWTRKLPMDHTVTQIAGAIDLLPTLTSLAGVPRVGDKPLDGRDLSPLLLQQATDWSDRMIFSTWANRFSVRTQKYRLDDQGKLFDMSRDPNQTRAINDHEPETARQLANAIQNWKAEVLAGTSVPSTNTTGKAGKQKKAGGGNSVDPRPFTVGYREFPITMLPARDGEPRGGVRRSSSAPNCSYFVNWTSKEDSMVWSVDVHAPGMYEVTIDYTCPDSDVGSLIEVAVANSRLTGRVATPWDPPLYTNQDTLPRPVGESQMKEFRSLNLGKIQLPKGINDLTLRALEIPQRSVMDVRRVTLTLLE